MTWFLIVGLLLLLIFSYLLLAPFYLEIDSEQNLVMVRFHGLASGRLVLADHSIILLVEVSFWKKKIDLLALKSPVKQPKTKNQEGRTSKVRLTQVLALFRSFRVNQFQVRLDLGNPYWNGILFPAFFGLKQLTGKDLQINFQGENVLKIEIENNLARILKAFIFNNYKADFHFKH